MRSLLNYELKKTLMRPFALVVCLGCIGVTVFFALYAAAQSFTYAWDAEAGVQQNAEGAPVEVGQIIVSTEEDAPGTQISFWEDGLPEGALELTGAEAIRQDKEYAKYFEGTWDNDRLGQVAAEYLAYKNNPDIYTDEIDEWAMQSRGWILGEQMSPEDMAAYDAENPIYKIKPEYQYGEGQKWSAISQLLEEHVVNPDDSIQSFEEAFPLVEAPAVYEYHNGPHMTTQMQGMMIGLLAILMLVAGISPIFSDEVASRTEPMLLASKYGRDKLIQAKLLSGLLFSAGCLLILTVLNVLLNGAAYGFSGWHVPLQFDSFTYSVPFTFTYLEYFFAILGFQALGLFAMAAFVMLLSAVVRSAIPVVFAGGLFSVFITMLVNLALGFWLYFSETLPPGAASPIALLNDGLESGWGVLPIPQWVLTIIVCAAIFVVSTVFITRKYKKLSKV